MAKYRLYQGHNIFQIDEDKNKPIVEGFLYENDCMMIVAPPKMSKSVFAMQMACNISSGTHFLDTFEVPDPQRILYIATEMKDNELKDRFIRTSRHVKVIPKNMNLICTKGSMYKFNSEWGKKITGEIIEIFQHNPPKVVFIDSVFKAFAGKMTTDDTVNDFLTQVDRIAKDFDAATVLVHHSKKLARDLNGQEFKAEDSDTYGSQFFLASVDCIVRLEKVDKEDAPLDRYVRSDTQRTGGIMKDFRIRLSEPDPLYFHTVDNIDKEKHKVVEFLVGHKEMIGINNLIKSLGFSRSKLYRCLKELIIENRIKKSKGRPRMYGHINAQSTSHPSSSS